MEEAEHSRGSRHGRGTRDAGAVEHSTQNVRLGGRQDLGGCRVSGLNLILPVVGSWQSHCEHGCGGVWSVE